MVTGGVNLNNAAEWFNAGIDAIGIGGELNKLAAKGQFENNQRNCTKICKY